MKQVKALFIIICFIGMIVNLKAQSFQYIYSTPDDEIPLDAIEDSSGNYYIVGAKGDFNLVEYDGLLIKLNANGDSIRTNLIDTPFHSLILYHIRRIHDNLFVLIGTAKMQPMGDYQIYFAQMDSSLSILSQKTMGSSQYSEFISAYRIGFFNEYILAGRAHSISTNDADIVFTSWMQTETRSLPFTWVFRKQISMHGMCCNCLIHQDIFCLRMDGLL